MNPLLYYWWIAKDLINLRPNHMEIWIRLIEGQNLKLRCRCFATFFCGDAVFVIFSAVLRCGQSPNV